MTIIDNITDKVIDHLIKDISNENKLSIAAAYFSIYAYEYLKIQLEKIDDLRFIFTSPTFINEKLSKEKREFYIPRLNREKSVYGTEYEVKLRNELTQKAIAKECVEWIKKKVTFKSIVTNESIDGFLTIEGTQTNYCYFPLNEFTTVGLGCERGNNIHNMIIKLDSKNEQKFINLFNDIWHNKEKVQDVTNVIIENISNVYKENSPEFVYFFALYNIFSEFLENISEDNLPNEATGFKNSHIWKNVLYDFQKDAALAIISKLEQFNGCILADSVGLGKTFTALAVIKYYENRNKSVLVLCPKKLYDNWVMYKSNYSDNVLINDRLRYDVLFHTDLSRTFGSSNGLDLEKINWGNYDLLVIDESHNFRNGAIEVEGKQNRYKNLLNKIIRNGVKTKVLMLSATPVNNRFRDLKNQLELAYEGDPAIIEKKLKLNSTIESTFRSAQNAYNMWKDLPSLERTTDTLIKTLDFDFFKLLDSVTIARSRKHIERYYDISKIGKFPKRLPVKSVHPPLTFSKEITNYNIIYDDIIKLNLYVYMPSNYIYDSKISKYYVDDFDFENIKSKAGQKGREFGIKRLMTINLLKRLESSVHSFNLTIKHILDYILKVTNIIHQYQKDKSRKNVVDIDEINASYFDVDDQATDLFTNGKSIHIELADMDCLSWLQDMEEDIVVLKNLVSLIDKITPNVDAKLITLSDQIEDKIKTPINANNKKIVIFSAFADTAEYLFNNLANNLKQKYNLNSALITGINNKSTLAKSRNDVNYMLSIFSPRSKNKNAIYPNDNSSLDILFATDCISEGQNLQDCDFVINYDIHWNPVRIIQRFGRVDRIGSINSVIQLVNYWPDVSLDAYINLKSRVESRMKVAIMSSTGDGSDNIISDEELKELEYRKSQLEQLQKEVVDLEDMTSGVTIMDLGLNEFRLDLIEYVKQNPDIENTPFGMHSIVKSEGNLMSGVIYILKSRIVQTSNVHQLHPFYLVYIGDDAKIHYTHLESKKILDKFRLLCKSKAIPDKELCKIFNNETNDGKDMTHYSKLLQSSINAIINKKEQSNFESLFTDGESNYGRIGATNIDDFELICFLIIK